MLRCVIDCAQTPFDSLQPPYFVQKKINAKRPILHPQPKNSKLHRLLLIRTLNFLFKSMLNNSKVIGTTENWGEFERRHDFGQPWTILNFSKFQNINRNCLFNLREKQKY